MPSFTLYRFPSPEQAVSRPVLLPSLEVLLPSLEQLARRIGQLRPEQVGVIEDLVDELLRRATAVD